jgi:ligand-binding sensor domain-containing protein
MKYIVLLLLHGVLVSHGQFTHIRNPLGSLKAAESRTINAITFDQYGNAFLGTHWNTIKESSRSSPAALFIRIGDDIWKEIRFDKLGNSFEEIYNLKIEPKTNLLAFTKTKGTVYTTNLGYYGFDEKYKFTDLLSGLKLPQGVYSDVQFDKNSNLWFSQESINFRVTGPNGYLGKLTNEQLLYTSFPWPVSSFKLTEDNSVFTKGKFLIYNYDLISESKTQITDRADTFIEIGTDNTAYYCAFGKLYIHQQGKSTELSSLPDNLGQDSYSEINCTFIDHKNRFYLGTRKGLYIFAEDEWIKYDSQNSNLESG